MKVTEIRETSTADLKIKVVELKEELFALKFQQASGKAENACKAKTLRKDIARILTVLKERELLASKEGE